MKKNKIITDEIYKAVNNDITTEKEFNTFFNNLTNKKNNPNISFVSSDLTCPCGKETYVTRQDAENALKQRKNTNKTSYRCTICGHFHLTSNNRRVLKTKNCKQEAKNKNERSFKNNIKTPTNKKFEKEIETILSKKYTRKPVANLKLPKDVTNNNVYKLNGITIGEILLEKIK